MCEVRLQWTLPRIGDSPVHEYIAELRDVELVGTGMGGKEKVKVDG